MTKTERILHVQAWCWSGFARWVVAAWNSHRIDHRGTPNSNVTSVGTTPSAIIPDTATLVQQYESSGGSITRPTNDKPIPEDALRQIRDEQFFTTTSTLDLVYERALQGDLAWFSHCLHEYVSITKNFQPVSPAR